MLARYIVYNSKMDSFLSSHLNEVSYSEFPEEYEIFDTKHDAEIAIDHVVNMSGTKCVLSDFSVEEF